jgi:glutamine amidotransferase
MGATVTVLDYGSGNLHSVTRALAHVGADVRVATTPGDLNGGALLIPGVGHLGQCLRALRSAGFEEPIRSAVAAGAPVFGVCVGMQILFEGGDEDPEPGLAVVPGRVRKLPDGVVVPHMGWNTVSWTGRQHAYTAGLPDGGHFYFVHSYAPDPSDRMVGATDHGRTFAAAIADGSLFATQFHPEKSGELGLALYAGFVREVRAA